MVKPKTMPMEESFTVLEYLVKSCTIDTPTIKLPTIKDTAVAKEIGSTGGAETISPAGTTVNVFYHTADHQQEQQRYTELGQNLDALITHNGRYHHK